MLYDGPGELVQVFDGPNYGPLWFDKYPIAIVAHTTETKGRPGYSGGSSAPQITIDSAKQVVWQHQPLDRRGGSLRGTKRVHTDTGVWSVMNEKAIQVEIIGYSDRNAVLKYKGGRRWVGDFGDDDYAFIAAVIHYLKNLFGVGNDIHARPPGHSWAYGIKSPYRLGAREWEQFSGLTAHGGVFGQDHWDTGVLDLNRIWTPNQGDDEMIRQLTAALRPEDIDRAHDTGVIGPNTKASRDTWKARLKDPDHPDWARWWAIVLSTAAEKAGKSGGSTLAGGEYTLTLEGKARPA